MLEDNEGMRQAITNILGIDTQFVEILGDNSITIGNREQRISLCTNSLQTLFKRHSLNFSFLNCKINNNQNSPTNNIIGIKNSNETQWCEFENCEFDDFCVSSWLIANLRFVDCSFNENLQFKNCQTTNIELNHNIIRESFSLENTSQTNTSLTICFTRIERAVRIKGKFHQIDLTNISTAKLDFSSLKIQGETNFLKVANDNEEPQIQGYENQIQQFSIIKSEIGAKVDFNNMNCKDIQILNCIFMEDMLLPKICQKIKITETTFKKDIYTDETCFDEAKFDNNTFEYKANFHSCQFENNASFSRNIFKHNVYFNNSIFKNYADFHGCEFEKGASFYGVSFEKTPNFSQALFKSNVNMVNTNLNFDFADLKSKIQEEYQRYNENNIDTEQKTLENFTNDFRDSFRNFKSTLIANHNTLDALNFHRAELYCKEIELRQKWDKKGIEAKNEADMRKNILKFKECIDYLLLCFYRKLCEHHTDFLRVFNNLILLIALYVAFFCIGNFELLIENATNAIKSPIQIHSDFLNMITEYMKPYRKYIVCVCLIALAIVSLCAFLVFIKQVPTIKLIVGTSYKSFIRDIVDIIITTFFILFALAIVDGYAPKEQFHLSNMYLFCFFVAFYLWLVCIRTLFLRCIAICVAYILTFIGIGTSIALINPLIGKLVDDSIKINNPSLSSITFAYTILMILVLFSLQKTARKNSIVPS